MLKCFLGIHSNEWIYLSEKNCIQEWVCSRCGRKSGQTREIDDYSEWESSMQQKCEQERICRRCGHKQHRSNHNFSEWEGWAETQTYESAGSSRPGMWTQVDVTTTTVSHYCRKCKDCGFVEYEENEQSSTESNGGGY